MRTTLLLRGDTLAFSVHRKHIVLACLALVVTNLSILFISAQFDRKSAAAAVVADSLATATTLPASLAQVSPDSAVAPLQATRPVAVVTPVPQVDVHEPVVATIAPPQLQKPLRLGYRTSQRHKKHIHTAQPTHSAPVVAQTVVDTTLATQEAPIALTQATPDSTPGSVRDSLMAGPTATVDSLVKTQLATVAAPDSALAAVVVAPVAPSELVVTETTPEPVPLLTKPSIFRKFLALLSWGNSNTTSSNLTSLESSR